MMEWLIIAVVQLSLVLSAFAVLPKQHMVKADWLLVPSALLPVVGLIALLIRSIIIICETYGDDLQGWFNTPFTKLNPWEQYDKTYKYIYKFHFATRECIVITSHKCESLKDLQEQSFNNFDFHHQELPPGHYDLTYLTREEYEKRKI